MNLHEFSDIHTHDPGAPAGSVINLPWGADVPPTGYYSVGIHPWQAHLATEADYDRLDRLASDGRVVAIGETGLDALRGAPVDEQMPALLRHIDTSERVGKPLIIHAVRTLPQIMQLRKRLRPTQRWIIHGYRGNAITARQLAALGIGVSLGHNFRPEVLDAVETEFIYRETDNPAP